MNNFWENNFKAGNINWGNEPADSAIFANEIFITNNVKNILIPGIGYGRNAGIFIENGISVTGIEISQTAIKMAKNNYGLEIPIHRGSVINMPFDNELYDGIYCYAVIHLLSKPQRRNFIQKCYRQLNDGGLMIFTMISDKVDIYGEGKYLSKNRYKLPNGLAVYFYNIETAKSEFKNFGVIQVNEIDEPIKFKNNEPALKLLMVVCKKEQ